jgi:hypothetical protein
MINQIILQIHFSSNILFKLQMTLYNWYVNPSNTKMIAVSGYGTMD